MCKFQINLGKAVPARWYTYGVSYGGVKFLRCGWGSDERCCAVSMVPPFDGETCGKRCDAPSPRSNSSSCSSIKCKAPKEAVAIATSGITPDNWPSLQELPSCCCEWETKYTPCIIQSLAGKVRLLIVARFRSAINVEQHFMMQKQNESFALLKLRENDLAISRARDSVAPTNHFGLSKTKEFAVAIWNNRVLLCLCSESWQREFN